MTAIEYIKEKLLGDEYWYENMTFDQIIDKAKEMDKKQMIEFGKIVADKWGMMPVPLQNIEDTYNETFKSE